MKYKNAQIISIGKRDCYYEDRQVLKNVVGKFREEFDRGRGFVGGDFKSDKPVKYKNERKRVFYFYKIKVKYL